ncbi:MAG: hypothetical protein HWD58_19885 [Bacteroidota bacterium]|nr:MAG: hypothetical protein HWD58_19885 [Bacteroidota bacterium]
MRKKKLAQCGVESLETEIETQRQQTEQILADEIDKLKQQLNISISNTPTNLFQKISKDLRHWNYKRKSTKRKRI